MPITQLLQFCDLSLGLINAPNSDMILNETKVVYTRIESLHCGLIIFYWQCMQLVKQASEFDFVNDGQRYKASIHEFFHEGSHVIYVVYIVDQCFNHHFKLYFRYKTLRKVHEDLMKNEKLKYLVPEFPKTKSFLFLNQTNRNSSNIRDRARELEYYLYKLLNISELAESKEVKLLLSKAKTSFRERRRSKSEDLKTSAKVRKSSNSLEKQKSSTDFDKKKSIVYYL